jgi:hypothetical protein
MGLMQHPDLPDHFNSPPSGQGMDQQRKDYYMDKCWPSVERIVERVEEVRRVWESTHGESPATKPVENNQELDSRDVLHSPHRLRHLYIMTNALPTSDFYIRLKELLAAGDWDTIVSVNDLKLTEPQSHITQAIDAAIGERATVFVGNGVSGIPDMVTT